MTTNSMPSGRAWAISALVGLAVFASRPQARAEGQPAASARLLGEAKQVLLSEFYDDKLDAARLDRAALRGMLIDLNGGKPEGPNALLDPNETADLKRDLQGDLVGIGTMIDYDEPSGMTRVEGLLPGSTAAAAGIERGDRILSINGVAFRGKPIGEVVKAIRGPEGTAVKISLLRGSATVEKSIVRKRLSLPSVEQEHTGDVGVITIRMFGEHTPAELETALKSLGKAGMARLLVDLRGNGGGLFEKSIASAELVLPKGAEIARAIGRGGKVVHHTTKRDPMVKHLPMVVLVDKQTASSAEILAEALRVGAGATLVGARTFGKWRMEALRPLSDGFTLKYTIALLQSPAGKSYDGVGVPPDVEVAAGAEPLEHTRRLTELDKRADEDPQLRAALHILRRLRD